MQAQVIGNTPTAFGGGSAKPVLAGSMPNFVSGQAYSFLPIATGGVKPYRWSISGAPSGVSINPASGQVSGTPSTTGSATITVTDALGASASLTGGAAPTTVRRGAGWGMDGGNRSRPSNGTNNSFNVIKRFYTPVPIANPCVTFAGFHWSSAAEFDNPSNQTFEVSLRVGSTILGQLTKNGSTTIVVPPGTVEMDSDALAGVTVPAGWVEMIYNCRVPSGQLYYYTDFFRSAGAGRVEEGVDLASKVLTPDTIGNATQYLPAGPIGIKGDMTVAHRMFMLPGDSISVGVGGYSHPSFPGVVLGILAGLIASRDTASTAYIHFGRSGAAAQQVRDNMTKRLQLAAWLGVTDSFSDLGINDLQNYSAAQVTTSINIMVDNEKAALPNCRRYHTTITPSTTITSTPTSDTNQTTTAALQDGRRNTFNTGLRNGTLTFSPKLAGVVEFAIPAQNALNADWWVAGYCSDSIAGQALHPNQTGGAAIVTSANASNPLSL